VTSARGRDIGLSFGPRQEYRFSGSGGQGLQLAAMILADAATTLGKEVVQTQSYGPEARGGASRSEVIVSDWEIDFPEVTLPDVTLCLSQLAYNTFAARTRRDGLLVYDSGLVQPRPVEGVVSVGHPFTEMAREHAGTPLAANIVSLAALVRLAGSVARDALEGSLQRRLPERLLDANMRAFAAGWEVAARPATAGPSSGV
jgi:2-oxoglutarate ferredoxin oxidoreductase subunit gamma